MVAEKSKLYYNLSQVYNDIITNRKEDGFMLSFWPKKGDILALMMALDPQFSTTYFEIHRQRAEQEESLSEEQLSTALIWFYFSKVTKNGSREKQIDIFPVE